MRCGRWMRPNAEALHVVFQFGRVPLFALSILSPYPCARDGEAGTLCPSVSFWKEQTHVIEQNEL